jgi:phosphatidylserine decarboxylase
VLQIAIFLSLFDVHVQRAPIAGRITRVELIAGGYRNASFPTAAENFRQTLYFDTDWGPIAVSQIAGLLARRIVRWVGPGDDLAAGDRIGIIKFGSRVTVRLPLGSQVLVRVGDKVRAGLTAVARRP